MCEDCGQPLIVRMGSIVGVMRKDRKWTAQSELVTTLYRDVRKGLQRDEVRDVEVLLCPACANRNPARLMWVSSEAEPGVNPDAGLFGPFCSMCFRGFHRKLENQQGAPADLPVYYIQATPKNIGLIKSTPLDMPKVQESVTEDEGNDVEGLF